MKLGLWPLCVLLLLAGLRMWLLGILLLLGRLFAGWKTHQKQMEAWEEAPEEVMQLFHRCIPRGKAMSA